MADKKEIEKRIMIVSKQILEEVPTIEILQNAAEKWNLKERQTRTYIRRCYNLWHKDFEKKRKRNLDYHYAKRADLYKQAYSKKQWNICLDIIKDEAKLSGSYPSEKHDVKVDGEIKFYNAKQKLINKIDSITSRTGTTKPTK